MTINSKFALVLGCLIFAFAACFIFPEYVEMAFIASAVSAVFLGMAMLITKLISK